MRALLHLLDLELVLGADRVERGHLVLEGDRIRNAGKDLPSTPKPDHIVDGRGFTAFPGLINAHEHLVGTWSPRTGLGLHPNVYSWLDRYMDHPVRRERMKVPETLIYRLGMYRNLLSGVTTVLDHFTRVDPSPGAAFPLRVLTEFGREWVMRSRTAPDLYPPWGEGIEKEMASTGGKVPFVIHIAEGVDEECRGELARLAEVGGLLENSILVHGVAFEPSDVERVAKAGARVVWCPASNAYLYGRTLDVKALLDAKVPVALGTDSTITGSAHLLEELRFADESYRQSYGETLAPSKLVSMVTDASASVIMAQGRLGRLAEGASADVLVVEGAADDPWERLLEAEPERIDLLIASGRPVLGSRRHEALFRALGGDHSLTRIQGREKWVAGDPGGLLAEIRALVGEEKRFHFLPLDGA